MIGLRYDWVSTHAQCNVRNLFKQLKIILQQDCESARGNGLTHVRFTDYQETDAFVVNAAWGTRVFTTEGRTAVIVKDGRDTIVIGKPQVVNRVCGLDVDGEFLTIPEFSERALVEVFFEQPR